MKLQELFSLKNDEPIEPQPARPPINPKTRWIVINKKELRKVFQFDNTRERTLFMNSIMNVSDRLRKPSNMKVEIHGLRVEVALFPEEIVGITTVDADFARLVDDLAAESMGGIYV